MLLSSLSSSPAQQVHGDTNRFGGTLNQFASTGDLIKALLDPETEQAMWFIFCSTVVLITGKLFFGALRGTVVHKILLEYLLKIMTPNIGNDWPHSETIIVPPSSGKHKTTVIFLHGLGDGSGYWENGVQALKMEDTKFILPAAPILPVSINMNIQMPAWYNIIGLEDDSPEDDEGIARACRDLVDIVQQEIDEFGIAPSNIALGGFSQGGAVVLHTVYRKGFLKHRVGGVLTMCSYMPRTVAMREEKGPVEKANAATPCFFAHGTDDTMVKFSYGERSSKLLSSGGVPVTFKTYQGIGHMSTQEMLDDASRFLKTSVWKKSGKVDDDCVHIR